MYPESSLKALTLQQSMKLSTVRHNRTELVTYTTLEYLCRPTSNLSLLVSTIAPTTWINNPAGPGATIATACFAIRYDIGEHSDLQWVFHRNQGTNGESTINAVQKPTKWPLRRGNLSPPLSGTLLHLASFHAHNGPELANASSPLSEHDHPVEPCQSSRSNSHRLSGLCGLQSRVEENNSAPRVTTWRTELWAIDRISHLRWLSMGWAGQNEKRWQLNTWIQENCNEIMPILCGQSTASCRSHAGLSFGSTQVSLSAWSVKSWTTSSHCSAWYVST